MTVVEAYVGKKKIDPPDDSSQFDLVVSTLLNEGIAQNTTGSVFVPKVTFPIFKSLWLFFFSFFLVLINEPSLIPVCL